jgi:hypothetical protein
LKQVGDVIAQSPGNACCNTLLIVLSVAKTATEQVDQVELSVQ